MHVQWAQQMLVPSTIRSYAFQMHPFQLDLHLPQLMEQQVRQLCALTVWSMECPSILETRWCHCSCRQTPEIIRSPSIVQLL